MRPFHLAIPALLISACSVSEQAPLPVEIAALLSNPTMYEGKTVLIRGAAVFRFEASFVCPTPDYVDSGRSKSCLWMSKGPSSGARFTMDSLHGKNVELTGVLDPTQTGHMDAYGGTFEIFSARITGAHGKGDIPPAPPPPADSSANNSLKRTDQSLRD